MTNSPAPGDLLVTWNRIGAADHTANIFHAAGCPVIVAENASWGNEFAGDRWYHLALHYHNNEGCFPIGDDARWDSLGVALAPWRTEGETVILMQRGIGPPCTAQPAGWHPGVSGRVRGHPGQRTDRVPLEVDLAHAGRVITWGSGAAIKALIWGIPVESHFPAWIGRQDNTDAGRLAMFRRLAWAQWRHAEIARGDPFRWLLQARAA
jgi:hypothetical protein